MAMNGVSPTENSGCFQAAQDLKPAPTSAAEANSYAGHLALFYRVCASIFPEDRALCVQLAQTLE
ncbi:hypothetical protein AWENTII_001647 [Aspergillus wentii]